MCALTLRATVHGAASGHARSDRAEIDSTGPTMQAARPLLPARVINTYTEHAHVGEGEGLIFERHAYFSVASSQAPLVALETGPRPIIRQQAIMPRHSIIIYTPSRS